MGSPKGLRQTNVGAVAERWGWRMDIRSLGRGASLHRALLFLTAVALGMVVLAAEALRVPEVRAHFVPLLIGGGALLVVASFYYVLAPLFSSAEGARARAAYGTTRDVLANGIAGVAIGNLVFVPLLLAVLVGGELWQGEWEPSQGLEPLLGTVRETLSTNMPLLVFLSLVGLDLALLLVVWLRLLRTGATTERELGWTTANLLPNLGLGVVGWVVVVVAEVVIGLILVNFGVVQNQAQQFGIEKATRPVFFLLLFGMGVLAPIAEETFFRGYIFRSYLTSLGPVWAFALSAVIFGVLHLNLAALLPLVVIGLILAYLFYRTGSLVPSMVAHGLNNMLAASAVYFTQQGG